MAYSTINKSTDNFNTKLYSGDGTSNRSITGVNFQPDLVWLKSRNSTNSQHLLDSVRGLFRISSQDTSAEQDASSAFKSFDSDGFTVTEEASLEYNNSGKTYASWNWKANGTGSANTDGSISSTVSANTTSGFSIVSYTGTGANATVGHGLGVAPSWIVIKGRNQTEDWTTYHASTGNTKNMILNSSAGADTHSTYWQDTSPTSSVFYLGSSTRPNTSTGTYIAYCFAEKQGYSKFGSYTGNGNADGTFVYLGFKPTFVIMKRTDVADSWLMKDSVRDSYNLANKRIFANVSSAEDTHVNGSIDILSNGFKQRGSDTLTNASGGTYIYMAFGQPIISNSGTVATAR